MEVKIKTNGKGSLSEQDLKLVRDAIRLQELQAAEKLPDRPAPTKKFCVVIRKNN